MLNWLVDYWHLISQLHYKLQLYVKLISWLLTLDKSTTEGASRLLLMISRLFLLHVVLISYISPSLFKRTPRWVLINWTRNIAIFIKLRPRKSVIRKSWSASNAMCHLLQGPVKRMCNCLRTFYHEITQILIMFQIFMQI